MANKQQMQDHFLNMNWDRFWAMGWQPNFRQNGPNNNTSMSTGAFAEGGYVTGPTNAIIGEGGENEFVIPESKMSIAMQRYGNGMRGSSVIPESGVTINYSGSTVNFNGDDYIRRSDVGGIVNQATQATAAKLNRSASYRLRAGV